MGKAAAIARPAEVSLNSPCNLISPIVMVMARGISSSSLMG
jgi:hypothetical protein